MQLPSNISDFDPLVKDEFSIVHRSNESLAMRRTREELDLIASIDTVSLRAEAMVKSRSLTREEKVRYYMVTEAIQYATERIGASLKNGRANRESIGDSLRRALKLSAEAGLAKSSKLSRAEVESLVRNLEKQRAEDLANVLIKLDMIDEKCDEIQDNLSGSQN